jgi:hypothetical protein
MSRLLTLHAMNRVYREATVTLASNPQVYYRHAANMNPKRGSCDMRNVRAHFAAWPVIAGALVAAGSAYAQGPTTEIKTEYLMTMLAPLDSSEIDKSLYISDVRRTGGWVKGPRIHGAFIPPGGDWLRVMPSGSMRLDVRLTLKTDDGALIYISYNGVFKESPENEAKLNKGEVLTDKDVAYFMTAPTFETSSPKYAWLNGVQAIGKMIEYKEGSDPYVKYDVFIVR